MLKACLDCGAPSEESRCPQHRSERKAMLRQRPRRGTGARGSTRSGRKRREEVLASHGGRCFYCAAPATIGEHYIPLANGGPDTRENMVPACRPCNQTKGTQAPEAFMASAWLADRRRQVSRGIHIICLVGAPAAGKTHLREQVAKRLGIPHKGIDECGPRGERTFRWGEMLRWLREQTGVVLVESNVIPHEFADRLRRNTATVIEVTAPRKVREQRLGKRDGPGWNSKQYPVGFPIDRTVGSGQAGADAVTQAIQAAQTRSQSQIWGGGANHDPSPPDTGAPPLREKKGLTQGSPPE